MHGRQHGGRTVQKLGILTSKHAGPPCVLGHGDHHDFVGSLGSIPMPTRGSKFFECKHISQIKVEDTNSFAMMCHHVVFLNDKTTVMHEHAYLMLSFRRRAFFFLLFLHFGVTVKVCELFVLLRTCTG